MTVDPRRRMGVIRSFNCQFSADRRCWLTDLTVLFEGYPDAHIGPLGHDSEATAEAFAADILKLFDVDRQLFLMGKPCWALWNHADLQEQMAGIENMSGGRFTVQGFRRRHWANTKSAYDAAMERLDSEIAGRMRLVQRLQQRQQALQLDFVDWETAPRGYLIPREPLQEEADRAIEEGP